MPALIRRYIGFTVFFNLLLWIPVFYAFQKTVGLSDGQIFGIQSLYYVVFCLLEVPTGFFADRFGYRSSVLAGAGLLTVANVLPIAWPNYTGFLLHFLAVALARSLVSGAASAYMYEAMKQGGDASGYKKVEGDARFWSLIARVVAWAVVGWLMAWHLTLPYWISALNAGIATYIVWRMPVVMPVGEMPAVAGFTRNAAAALRQVVAAPYLLLLMLQGVSLFVTARVLQVNLYQPLLTSRAFDLTAFGWIMSTMTVCEAVGSRLSPKLAARLADRAAVGLLTGVIALAVLILAVPTQATALCGFCLFSFAAGLAFPVQKQLLNDAIGKTRLRATILSIESIIDRALCALVVLPLGGLVAVGKLDQTLFIFGVAMAVAALVVQLALAAVVADSRRTA